jgi:uncharacterized protein YbbC (DUF1343 family)/CubicO group peptidase (beta-lactamase class C family)
MFRISAIPVLSAALVLALGTAARANDESLAGRIDAVMRPALEKRQLPGAVILIVQRNHVIFRKAYGRRSVQPASRPMTPDTAFDLASLTKPIATATSILILVEQGKLRFADRVAEHWPAFAQNGKNRITIEQLLLHTSGLVADNPEADYRDGRDKAMERICRLTPLTDPGARFVYSDVNYIVLGELVQRLSGERLDVFAPRNIFDPLGMRDTRFVPLQDQSAAANALRTRAAPTVERDGHWLMGQVHDPRAYALGGVAGHAGLFSTADDLVRYVRMILGHGELEGRRVLGALTVDAMTAPRAVPGGLRTYGWDMNTAYSSNRGELFPAGTGFGHTGFTGTSIWIDPSTDTAVIFLSNRVHPDGKGDVKRLRGQVATIAASVVGYSVRGTQYSAPARDSVTAAINTAFRSRSPNPPPPTRHSPTLTGIDVLVREDFKRLRGRRVGLVTNHSGLDRRGRRTIDLLHEAKGVTLVALFSPEHGIRGAVEEKVGDASDPKTGLPIYSLYGARYRPTSQQLTGIDTLVYDIQDAGCRFYTYISTLGYILEAAAQNKIKVMVLDRPNPIGGRFVEGPVLDAGRESFVGYHRLPVRHGLTVGELAQLYNAELRIGADLEVARMESWRRGDRFDATGLHWVNPSPNLRSLTQTLLYPGIGLLEVTNVSVGRGSDRPFEWIGAPWIDGSRLAASLADQGLPGVRFVPLRLTPSASTYRGQACDGVQLFVDDWASFQPVRTGLAVAWALHHLFPQDWQVERFDGLLGHRATWEGLKAGVSWRRLEAGWIPELEHYRELRRKYLIYAD